MNHEYREVLTSAEAGALLGVSAATVKRWSDEGALPSIRTRGGHRRFRRGDIEEAIARLRAARGGTDSLAERLLAGESVLRVQAELLAERARSGWNGVVSTCISTLRIIANTQRMEGSPGLVTRVAYGILADALSRCADELPTAPDARSAVIAAVEGEPFTVPLHLVRLAARAAGWKAWVVGATPAIDLASFVASRRTHALVLFASVSRAQQGVMEVKELLEPACAAAGVALALCGGAPWGEPQSSTRVLRALAEVGDWLSALSPAAAAS